MAKVYLAMSTTFKKSFFLPDGTEVQIRQSSEHCYEFMLVALDGTEDTFAWDINEPRAVIDSAGLNEQDRRRNESLQELWRDIQYR
jgi:hypothetical protein